MSSRRSVKANNIQAIKLSREYARKPSEHPTYDSDSEDCCLCRKMPIDVIVLPCRHAFCDKCLKRFLASSDELVCPIDHDAVEDMVQPS